MVVTASASLPFRPPTANNVNSTEVQAQPQALMAQAQALTGHAPAPTKATPTKTIEITPGKCQAPPPASAPPAAPVKPRVEAWCQAPGSNGVELPADAGSLRQGCTAREDAAAAVVVKEQWDEQEGDAMEGKAPEGDATERYSTAEIRINFMALLLSTNLGALQSTLQKLDYKDFGLLLSTYWAGKGGRKKAS